MADTLFIIPIQVWIYGILHAVAINVWISDRALYLAGFLIQAITNWMITDLFGPSIQDFAFLSGGLLPTFAMIAVFLMGIGYVLAPYFHMRVVQFQKAIGWLLFALVFFQYGPGIYVEYETARRAISSELYQRVLDQVANSPTGSISIIYAIGSGPDEAMNPIINQFGPPNANFIPTDTYIDGLDIAMAYTLSTGDEVVSSLEPLPQDFSDEYFDPATGPAFYLSMDADQRTESINKTLQGIMRLCLAYLIIIFGLFEQAIYLCLSIAVGILFLCMGFALLFSFFERTELMARSLVLMWLELFLTSIITSLVQALIVGMVLVGASTNNPALTLGAASIGLLMMLVLFLKALNAIWESLNRMFKAMSEVVGGGLLSPGELGGAVAGGLATAAFALATGGASAAVTAAAGGTLMQVAGSALSGSGNLYRASAIGSMVLPNDSPMKGIATEFQEGALASRMMPVVGGLALANKSRPLETPAFTDAHHDRTQEAGKTAAMFRGDLPVKSSDGSQTPAQVNQDVEMAIKLDAADLAGLREALSAAMSTAVLRAPTGGYENKDQSWNAVIGALGSQSNWRPGMGEYLDRHREKGLVPEYVQDASRQGTQIPAVHMEDAERRASIRYGRLAAHSIEVDAPPPPAPTVSVNIRPTDGSSAGNGHGSAKSNGTNPSARLDTTQPSTKKPTRHR